MEENTFTKKVLDVDGSLLVARQLEKIIVDELQIMQLVVQCGRYR